MRLRTLCFLVLFSAVFTTTVTADDSYNQDVDRWFETRVERLTRPDGYLSLVGLHWLSETPQTFEGVGTAHLEGDVVVLELEDGVSVDGQPVSNLRLGSEGVEGTPTFHNDDLSFYVIRRGPRVGLRVKSPKSPALVNFSGVPRFPVDSQWRLEGTFVPEVETIAVDSVVDVATQEASPGWAVFDFGGDTYKVRLMGEESDDEYFLVFSDATAGNSTYSACRFLNVEKEDDGGLVLDFNKAYNPPCSFTRFATCPLPPQSNIFPFEVPAGEKDSAH